MARLSGGTWIVSEDDSILDRVNLVDHNRTPGWDSAEPLIRK